MNHLLSLGADKACTRPGRQPTAAVLAVLLAAVGLLGAAHAQTAPAAPAETHQVPDEAPRFAVLEFAVEGNTVLPVKQIEQVLMPFMGPSRTMNDVEAARAALERAYQSAGYLSVFVDVPEQRVGGEGLITLQVIEGRVGRLSVSGSRYFSQGYIRSRVTEFAEGQVPNFNTVQRQLAEVNRNESRRVQPVLKPGPTPGTVLVDLVVNDALPLESSVEVHNQHAADTTPWRLAANLRYDNLFQLDHSIAVNLLTAPAHPSQSQVAAVNYSVPLKNGRTFSGYAAYSDSAVDTLGGFTALGKGLTVGLRYGMPFTSAQGAHNLSWGFDYKDLQQRLVDSNNPGVVTTTPLRYLPLQMAYTGGWGDTAGQHQLSLTFVGALRRVLRREVPDCPLADGTFGPGDQFACNRKGADGGFGVLRSDWRYTHYLPGAHQLSVRAAWQYAVQPLVSGEQFTAGGADTVRGYLESSATGDVALLGSVQWRSPALFKGPPAAEPGGSIAWVPPLYAVAFVDAARLTTRDPAAGQQGRVPLLGVGAGLRLEGRGRLSGALDVARTGRATYNQPRGSTRVHARVGVRF